MKVYEIKDEVRKLEGKNEITRYQYSVERNEQVRRRLDIYRRKGYKVKTQQNWWTTIEIVLI